jgi:hypothetical protein
MGLELLEDRAVPAVFDVNSLADILNPPPGVVTLRSAINAANNTPGGNTINLTVAGTYRIAIPGANTGTDASGAFAILPTGGNLTIQNTSRGNVTIDGSDLDRVFDINPVANPSASTPFLVTIQGVTITNGDASPSDGPNGSGGGIRDQGTASLTLINDTITNCFATADGGGISMENAVDTPWKLTIQNSTVSNCHAGDAGGGVEEDGHGVVTITNSTVTNNTCVNQGAGLWLDAINHTANTTLTGDTFTNNVAFNGPTGAIGNAGDGAVTISGCVVANNFVGGTAQGGAGFGDENGMGNLTVSNSQFINNVAVTSGGAIFAGASGTTTTITNNLFQGNVAQNGGGVEDPGSTLTLTNTAFLVNHAVGSAGGDKVMPGPGGDGGGLDVQDNSNVTVTNSLFVSNTAINGNATSNGGSLATGATTFFGDGGAIFQSVGNLTVQNAQFSGNVASVDGGGVAFFGTTLTVNAATFNNDHAASGSGGALALMPTGLASNGASSSLTNATITGNSAAQLGGGIADVGPGDLALLYDTINANTAGTGGGVAFRPGSGTPVLSFQNTIVAQNAAGTGPDVFSDTPVTDLGGNLVPTAGNGNSGFGPGTLTSSPRLSTLQNNGGPFVGVNPFPGYTGQRQVLQTEALVFGSPAINHGVTVALPTTDERGFPRPGRVFSSPAIGAYEPQFIGAPSQSFVVGLDNQVYARHTDTSGNPTGGYYLVAPGQVKALRLARVGDTGVEVFVIGLDNQVYAATVDASGNVNGYFQVAPGQFKSITAVTTGSGDPELFAVGLDNQVYAMKFDTSGNPMGGYFLTAPGQFKSVTAVTTGSGAPELFGIGLDNQVYAQKFDATGSPNGGSFLVAPGQLASISVVDDSAGNPELFGLGFNNQVYAERFNASGSPFGGYSQPLFGLFFSIAAGNDASGDPELFGVGLDHQVYSLRFNASGSPFGGYTLTAPGKVQSILVGANAVDQPEVFALMSDNQVYVAPIGSNSVSTGGYSLYAPGQVMAFTAK